ncbi:uncharacterized protein AKAME5_001763300 [Lates japonicus]|uniref:FAM194 C-terminal domain-containing protein n=1 Tax=Lates japonicus TaxID=270547 RepID=A0AAD3N3Y0_LATJO|nr:uncharacterized protein AKAME5_001763300 [Lates japonicus]
MSQSPSYQTDTASASPESPKEGDFSLRQLYDNLKSLEEHETCDDQKDPIVNIIPDNYCSSLLNAQICVPQATDDLGKLYAGMLPQEQLIKSSELVEFDMKKPLGRTKMLKYIIYKTETSSLTRVHGGTCAGWKIHYFGELSDPDRLGVGGALPLFQLSRLNLTPVGGLCFDETGDLKRRWKWFYFDPHVRNLPLKPLTFALGPHISVRIHTKERMYVTFTHQENSVRFNVGSKLESLPKNMKSELEISLDNEVLDSLSKEAPQTPAACQGETEESLTNQDKIPTSSGSDSSEEPLQTVLNICFEHCQELKNSPVTSDQIAKSVDPKEWHFLRCEKARKLSEILPMGATVITKETVTDTGRAMQKDQRVNLTPWGGTFCSDTGDLKKQWSWMDNKHHVHAPPYQPLCLTLSPNLNVRIESQEHICITFTSGKHSVQLNVGAKLKLNQGKGPMLPVSDMLQRYQQQRSAEINVLLQNIQSLITYQKTVSPQKVKPQQCLILQMERRRLPVKQQQSAKKTP